jgi:hypothetical protein
MASAAPPLDLGTARRIVQQHVGQDMQVTACWQRPEGIYNTGFDEGGDDSNGNFYFAVLETVPRCIGATRHVAVDRRTGAVIEIGMFGE